LLVVAYLRKGETYTDLACGFRIGTSTVYRYVREALGLLAAMAPTLAQAIEVARGKAFVILDRTLLRIDRVGVASGRDRPFYSGKHKAHGLNVQIIADPIGRLVWISPPLPGARHDMGAAPRARHHRRDHRCRDPGGRRHRLPRRRARCGRAAAAASPRPGHRPLPVLVGQPERRQRRPHPPPRTGERVNAELKNWKILRKIRSSPSRAAELRRRSSDPHDRQRLIRLAKAQLHREVDRPGH
jgi:Helix-turn-helix of DDE superfamily endonuclease/DDE superfamily endonuclease